MMKKLAVLLGTALGGLLVVRPAWAAGLPGDAESATHGDEAATLQGVKETEETTPAFVFRQYNLAVLSHYSYLIGSGGEAMIVDPARDISRYLRDAETLKLKITRVYLTHSHADFVAGHMELSKATGAPILVNKATAAGYPHEAIEGGTVIAFGDVRCRVMATPGHTPDGTCMLVHAPAWAERPKLVLTGDTLFIGSVGRPDLLGEKMHAADLAAMAYRSWTEKLAKLPDETRIFPAHGAGSLCGAHLSDKPVSTLGEQKKENSYVQHRDLHSFVTAMIEGLPEAPQYFGHNAKLNHDGPPLVDWAVEMPVALAPANVKTQVSAGAWMIDVRDAKEFAADHVAGALNIGVRGRFETWTGIMIPWGEPFLLTGSDAQVREATFRLRRIGYDAPAGYLEGGVSAWKAAGLETRSVQLVKPAELHQQMVAGKAPILIDVRLPAEWMGLRISQNMLNMPVNKIRAESARLNPSMPVMTICNSAYRSSLGASVLLKAGFRDVRNMDGGSEAWIAAGLPTFGSGAAHGPASAPGAYLNLPEPISPEELAKRLMDLPGAQEVVDIRPAWQFKDFSIGGSVNAPVEQVLKGAAHLSDQRPLVVVCRDGSISAAVAGILVERGQRPIRYLSGGVRRYYDEAMRPKGIRSEAMPVGREATPAKGTDAGPASAAPAAPAAPSAPVAKKKSAGC
jgi:rhodanese-related sulfurtransferase/glyoxylase-like metal-dependent hydrolase (beta-lactamase superfamily II)